VTGEADIVNHVLHPSWAVTLPEREGPRLLHVNATATGGGVAELLNGLIPAQSADGISVGWAVISGTEPFFALTKRIHHLLHGQGDPDVLGRPETTELYRSVLRSQADWLAGVVGADDVVVLHDPQTLGLAPGLVDSGARIVWHCHIGTTTGDTTPPAAVWRFFSDELPLLDAVLTTRSEFAPDCLPQTAIHVAAPAIDPLSLKNRELTEREIADLLDGIGLCTPRSGVGSNSTVDAVVEQDQVLPTGALTVLQVSRWDPLKDMGGVLRCFSSFPDDVHLVLAGPDPSEVSDDPEGLAVLAALRADLARTPRRIRERVHLVIMSMRRPDTNALLVNALQRRADVVLQKSLEEGFGLTLTEAMIKRKAVVASDVGGLSAQVEHGRTGLLVDPLDDAAVVAAVRRLLADPALRREIGERAAAAVSERFLMSRLVADYRRVVATAPSSP